VTAIAAAFIFVASPAQAATPPVGVFPVITATGTGFDATFTAASGMPTAHIVTDAAASPAAGASAFLGAATTFGAEYGSSRKQPYLTVPSVPPFAASTTTITFDSPTPIGWGFALGDVDADYVSIAASTGPTALTTAQLGVQAPGNYCDGASPSPTACSGVVAPFDVPAWCGDPVPAANCAGKPVDTLLGSGTNTAGAYGWFRPTVPVTSVTLTFTPQLGFPTFQLWLVALFPAATVTGTIVTPDPLPAETTLMLLDDAGAPVTDILDQPVLIPVDPDGDFEFETAFGDYQLDFDPPPGVEVAPDVFPLEISADRDTLELGSIALADAVDPPGGGDPTELVRTGVDPAVPIAVAVAVAALGLVLLLKRRKKSG
jgi:hypothetical protein